MAENSDPMKNRHLNYYLAGAVLLLTFAVYLPSLQNSFVQWDDDAYIFENPFIRSFDAGFFRRAFFSFYAANWHPLTWISHALDYAVWGLNPMGHHLANNILHAVNTFLVVLLAARLIEVVQNSRFAFHDSRFTLIAAGVTGLLFGLHPLHVESVAWASERKDLLCALFFLLSVLTYVSYRSHKANKTYILSLCFFILALLSKPMAVSLPIILLILDWYPFKRINSINSFWPALMEKIPFLILSLISSMLTLLAQRSGDAILSTAEVPLWTRTIAAAKSLLAYLLKMIYPVDLVPFYPYPVNTSFLSLGFIPVVFTAGMTIAGIATARKQKLWLAAWGYFVVTLAPVLGIVQVGSQAMADRYSYLPSIGPFLIAALGFAWLVNKLNMTIKHGLISWLVPAAAAVFVFSSLGYLTVRQIGIWKGSMDLWNYVIDKEPMTYFAYNNRGITLFQMGQIDAAIDDYNKSIAIYPNYFKAHYNMGLALYEKGFPDGAIQEYQFAVRLNPQDINAHLNLGVAYSKKGLTENSAEEYRLVEKLSSGSVEPFYKLGSYFTARGLLDEAIEQLQIAVRMKPDSADAHNNLAAALFRKGRVGEALEHYRIVSELRPADAAAHSNLGSAFAALGQIDKAIDEFQSALRLDPSFADAHYNLGMALQIKGLLGPALEHLEAAARLNPTDSAIRNDLARAKFTGRK